MVRQRLRLMPGQETFALPCNQLCGTACRVYELRPLICREFECQLLQTHRRGFITKAEGTAAIEKAKRLRRELTESAGLDDTGPSVQRVVRWTEHFSPDVRDRLKKLEDHLWSHFGEVPSVIPSENETAP